MPENLYYLFISGVILGSGPCLGLCAPLLASYTAVQKNSFQKAVFSYLTFSVFKLLGYAVLGIIFFRGIRILNNWFSGRYADYIYFGLGCFIILIGVTTLVYPLKGAGKICAWLHRGNVKNVGVLGFLVGLAPCLPLLGILDYVGIISRSGLEAAILALLFGVGTLFSPLLLLVVFTGGAAGRLSQNIKAKNIIRIAGGTILLVLGSRIILKILQP